MIERGTVAKYEDGEIIFNENDYGREMYVIETGKVKIFRIRNKREIVLATLKKGDFFGEMALFSGLSRSASVQAIGNCRLRSVNRIDLKKIVDEPVIWRILQEMSQRIREFDDKMEDLLIEDELRKVIQLFRRYVAPQVVDEILKTSGTETLDLMGELREVTVLFADIRNFTSIAEKMQPHEVVELLNTYLGEMTHVVFRYDGTVDKYIGDAIMAVFNAPMKQKDHARLAVTAAMHIQEAVTRLQKDNPNISVGIGINTGSAILGNVGTELHLDYTVIGDAVNIASRLCRDAKAGELLISHSTYVQIKEYVTANCLDSRMFKGKTEPVKVYNVKNMIEDVKAPRKTEGSVYVTG
ncbi:MAG: adenylate/guanylate cyclase domain-containing protein [Actinomycetota bacterium]